MSELTKDKEKSIVLYLQMHQPFRVKRYSIFDTANDHIYFNDESNTDKNNRLVFERVCNKSYRPMLNTLKRLTEANSRFKFTLSLTGTFIEQAEAWAPDVLAIIQQLIESKNVELLGETYYHSLAFYYDKVEFETQVNLHRDKIYNTFGVVPTVFRNTELAYDDELAKWAMQHNYKGVLAEGWDSVLGWRSPNHLYHAANSGALALLTKNYRLSDDIAFRFSDQSWSEYPLTVDKYIQWIHENDDSGVLVNLFMDFETFGEHQWASTGIFDFFEAFISKWAKVGGKFMTTSDAISSFSPEGEISMPETVTWADTERDLSAWTGNSLQKEALKNIYLLSREIIQVNDQDLINDWRKLQTSDHMYYMSTKWSNDGDIHSYFSPYESPYEAFLSYMNVIRDLRWRIIQHRRAM